MPKLEYSNQGREGYVVYKDDISTLKFYFEFGGGACVAMISIPTEEKWEVQTKRPVGDRNSIINFVATQATKDQVKGGHFKITNGWIEIYK